MKFTHNGRSNRNARKNAKLAARKVRDIASALRAFRPSSRSLLIQDATMAVAEAQEALADSETDRLFDKAGVF